MGFNRPSKIQETALPIMLAYPPQNLIAQSQSGTGKTAAFGLAMLSRVNAAEKYPQCLCLAPTYELALQIGRVIETIGRFCADIRVTYAVRGNRVPQGVLLGEQIVIGTPGTMLDWCFKRRVVDVRKITLFVLDEADIMIDTQGLSCQSIRVQRALPKGCQMLLFSATFKETVRAFAMQIVSNPIVIKLREEELALSNIRQYFFVCRSREEKYRALCNIYGSITIGQAIIFCQVRAARRARGQRGQEWFVLQLRCGAPKWRSGDMPCVSLPLVPREASRSSAWALPCSEPQGLVKIFGVVYYYFYFPPEQQQRRVPALSSMKTHQGDESDRSQNWPKEPSVGFPRDEKIRAAERPAPPLQLFKHQQFNWNYFFPPLPPETKIKQLDPDDMDELENLEN
ncbi:ATP-dependent RNA helicase DDX25 [Egretta garzetta]|uniref:ATP-dependent RNA helicase DDX25 n=1 Tax=Egretta garzetta TaxID=188379 RepID=UPI00163CCF05|nr:ATP-dependent RNA helicase DDX25 [Egretta garzetta]